MIVGSGGLPAADYIAFGSRNDMYQTLAAVVHSLLEDHKHRSQGKIGIQYDDTVFGHRAYQLGRRGRHQACNA